MNFYNEIDPYAAQWLRNLITAGHIPNGVVDERSIEDIAPADLAPYTQCHFFAGIGGWPLALRLAGIADDFPIWTGSCPCQPFSTAGAQAGFSDERHLWPAWHWLIEKRRPGIVVGEQVASKAADVWVDLVQADMEGLAYAFGAVAFPSASIGAPHIRDRTYWMGYADNTRLEGYAGHGGAAGRQGSSRSIATSSLPVRLADIPGFGRIEGWPGNAAQERDGITGNGTAIGLANANSGQLDGIAVLRGHECDRADAGRTEGFGSAAARSESGRLDNTDCATAVDKVPTGRELYGSASVTGGSGPTNGFWRNADWLYCTDGKWRPVEPGTFPLAHGVPGRVGRLRAYGNAVNPWQAAIFLTGVLL